MATPQTMLHALRAMDSLRTGQVLKVTTDEPRSVSNFEVMCNELGHKLMQISDWDGETTLLLKKA